MKIMKKEIAPRYQRDNIESFLLVSKKTTNSENICVTLVEMQPGGVQHLHSHVPEQAYFILEGSGVMIVNDEERTVNAGECVYFPSYAKHGLRNTGKTVLKYLSAASPSFSATQCDELWPL